MLTTYAVRPGGHPGADHDEPRTETRRGFHDCRGTWHAWDDLVPVPGTSRPC